MEITIKVILRIIFQKGSVYKKKVILFIREYLKRIKNVGKALKNAGNIVLLDSIKMEKKLKGNASLQKNSVKNIAKIVSYLNFINLKVKSVMANSMVNVHLKQPTTIV